jgi:small subunit ribosomal protein S1
MSENKEKFRKDGGLDSALAQEIEAALGDKSLEEIMAEADGTDKPGKKSAAGVRVGKVIAINKSDIFVDMGGRSQGVVTLDQFKADETPPKVGDALEVLIDHYDESQGLLILTRMGIAQKAAWGTMAEGDAVEAKVTAVVKGGKGLECDVNGIRAFLPASQVDTMRVEDQSVYVGQKLTCEIVELDREANNVILSRRKLLEKAGLEAKKKTMAELAEGQVREGTVKTILPFGAFVDLGGVDGLVHVSDMSYSRVNDPNDAVKIGQTVKVQVLKIEEGGRRISLGMKQLLVDPWTVAAEKYKKGASVKGKITNLAAFGAFVEIEPGLEALIPISEMTYKKRINHPSEILTKGQEVEVSILEIDPARRRMSTSLRAFEPDPWAGVERHYLLNTVVPGKVTRITDFGAFVELEPGLDGLVHISEISDKPVQRASDAVRAGQEVQVRVLNVSEADRRISLSLKGMGPEPEPTPEEAAEAAKPKKKRKVELKGGL